MYNNYDTNHGKNPFKIEFPWPFVIPFIKFHCISPTPQNNTVDLVHDCSYNSVICDETESTNHSLYMQNTQNFLYWIVISLGKNRISGLAFVTEIFVIYFFYIYVKTQPVYNGILPSMRTFHVSDQKTHQKRILVNTKTRLKRHFHRSHEISS